MFTVCLMVRLMYLQLLVSGKHGLYIPSLFPNLKSVPRQLWTHCMQQNTCTVDCGMLALLMQHSKSTSTQLRDSNQRLHIQREDCTTIFGVK